MDFKKIMSVALLLGAMSFGATTASARSQYLGTLNTNLGTSFGDCIVCHGNASNFPKNKGVTPIASTRGNITATTDSDGDGWTDKQEVSGLNMYFNQASVTPFTVAAAAEGVTVTAGVNVIETGTAAQVTENTTADVYADFGITVPAGSEVVADIYATVTGNGATLTYRVPVPQGSTIYTVAAGISSDVTGSTTFNANGSITLGVNAADVVAVRITPVVAGSGTSSSAGGGGCLTASASTPLLMVLAMLALGFIARRKSS